MLRDKKDQQRGGGVFAMKLHTETHSCCGFEFCGIKFGLCSWVASKAPWRFVSNEGFYRCPWIGDFPINNPHGPIATAFCMLLDVEVRFGLCRAHYIFSITSAGRPFFLKSSVLDHFNHFYPFLMFCFVVCFCIPSHQCRPRSSFAHTWGPGLMSPNWTNAWLDGLSEMQLLESCRGGKPMAILKWCISTMRSWHSLSLSLSCFPSSNCSSDRSYLGYLLSCVAFLLVVAFSYPLLSSLLSFFLSVCLSFFLSFFVSFFLAFLSLLFTTLNGCGDSFFVCFSAPAESCFVPFVSSCATLMAFMTVWLPPLLSFAFYSAILAMPMQKNRIIVFNFLVCGFLTKKRRQQNQKE